LIIACNYNTYFEIADYLRGNGKREFEDFVYYEYIYKEIIFFHGNCHMSVLQSFMCSLKTFRDKYCIYHSPKLINDVEYRPELEVFQNISLYIHQDIKIDNKYGYYVSDEYIKSLIPIDNDVIEITVPNLYGLGKAFFPQNRDCYLNDDNLFMYRGGRNR